MLVEHLVLQPPSGHSQPGNHLWMQNPWGSFSFAAAVEGNFQADLMVQTGRTSIQRSGVGVGQLPKVKGCWRLREVMKARWGSTKGTCWSETGGV